jgi:hypothetical protein
MKRDGRNGADEIAALNMALAGFVSLASNPTAIPGSVKPTSKPARAYSDAEIDALFE